VQHVFPDKILANRVHCPLTIWPGLQVQMPKPASFNTQSRTIIRISCVERYKQKKYCSYRAVRRTGKHGSGYAKRWVGRAAVEKSVQDRPRKGRPSKLTERDTSFIKRLVEADARVGSAEIARKLGAEIGVSVTAKTVRNAL
jgi:transposase